MALFVLAYLGGVVTILSPCILPVLPFVFARADRPFVRSSLPMLVGTALTFALVVSLAAVAGGWAVETNRWDRLAAMALLVLPEQAEPVVALRAMVTGREVVEDYGHVGLTLRQHPVSFLRADLARRRVMTCAEAVASRDRRWVHVACLVLVRQRRVVPRAS